MKSTLLILLITFFAPSLAHAQWYHPGTWLEAAQDIGEKCDEIVGEVIVACYDHTMEQVNEVIDRTAASIEVTYDISCACWGFSADLVEAGMFDNPFSVWHYLQ